MDKKNFFQFFKRNGTSSDDLESLDEESKTMVRGIVELSETIVKEVMIPRIDTVFIAEDAGIRSTLDELTKSGHSRFPVYNETIDNVVGVLYVKDILGHLINREDFSIPDVLRPAYFVPESMKLDALLREMKQRRVHLAVAIDEYGGVSGIVTMENILEEIVGDIQDEFDNEGDDIIAISDNQWLCDARVRIEELNETIGMPVPEEDFDTLGGFVFDRFGKIPSRNEKVEWNGYVFVLHSVDGHKILKVRVVRKNQEESE